MFEEACRPVIFEQQDDQITYWGKGSSILLATSKHYYWITAAHVVKNMGGTPDNIRIFPSDHSRKSIPFNEAYRITSPESEDHQDYKDLLVFRVDLEHFQLTGDAPLIAQDIQSAVFPPENLPVGSRLLIVGYPSESRWIDYDKFTITHKRERLIANYLEPGVEEHTHKLQFSENVHISDYDGLSGSGVFYLKETTLVDRPALLPLFAGVLLRAGGPNRWGHFVSSSVLVNLIRKAEN